MQVAATRPRPIFVADCDCDPGTYESYPTDALAARAVLRHWRKLLTTDPAHRYWCVHGPSGHVIGLHGTPYGDLPPRP